MLALQECEGAEPLSELADKFEFAGSAEASETRGLPAHWEEANLSALG